MIRIFLPLAIFAAIFLGPMFNEETTGSVTGTTTTPRTGEYFIGEAVGCLRKLQAPIGEECASQGKIGENGSTMVGQAISWAAMLSLGAAALGVFGLLPFIGRLVSVVTILAGVGALGAMGLLALTMIGTEAGLPGLQWGAYLSAAAGLLTMISGLAGLRGR